MQEDIKLSEETLQRIEEAKKKYFIHPGMLFSDPGSTPNCTIISYIPKPIQIITEADFLHGNFDIEKPFFFEIPMPQPRFLPARSYSKAIESHWANHSQLPDLMETPECTNFSPKKDHKKA